MFLNFNIDHMLKDNVIYRCTGLNKILISLVFPFLRGSQKPSLVAGVPLQWTALL